MKCISIGTEFHFMTVDERRSSKYSEVCHELRSADEEIIIGTSFSTFKMLHDV